MELTIESVRFANFLYAWEQGWFEKGWRPPGSSRGSGSAACAVGGEENKSSSKGQSEHNATERTSEK